MEEQMSDSALTMKEDTMDAQLIGNNPQEEVLIKIRALQMQNATASQRKQITNLEDKIYNDFIWFIQNNYGLSKNQLFEFRDDQIESLFEVVNLSVKKKAIIYGILMWTFGLLIPFFGWMVLVFMYEDENPKSYFYARHCSKLRKFLGDKYFSAKRLREINP